MMPKMDGYQLTEKLKADLKTSHIPIILLTARASVESKIAGLETGADAYVTKPFNAKELDIRVSKLIEQRQKLREHFSQTLESEDRYLVKDPQLPSLDQKFVQKALDVVNDHLSDVDFDAVKFAGKMALSRVQLHRKLKALTNKTTSDFVRTVRLNKAAGLLRDKTDNVTQIAYETGFSSLSWFAKSFKQQFGVTPSEYNNLKPK
jgi:DNA-binding response OmpR family regulator